MDLTFAYETHYIILYHLFSIFILIFVNAVIWMKAKKAPLLYAYIAVQSIILLWMVSKIFKTIAPNASVKFAFVVLQYTGVCFLGEVFFVFSFLYATHRLPSKKTVVLLSVPPAAFLTILATNPFHHLFYAHFDFWGDSFGPVFYVHQFYNYALILAGTLLCAGRFRKEFGEKRIRAQLYGMAILFPIAANMLYIFNWFERIFGFEPPFDITPIACNLSLMLFAFATFKFRFFDDIKIARRHVLKHIPEGILLIDAQRHIIDFNDTFITLLPDLPFYTGNLPLRYESADFLPDVSAACNRICDCQNGRHIQIQCKSVAFRGHLIGYAIRFSDITQRQHLLRELEEKNQLLDTMNKKLREKAFITRRLAIVKTRNAVAGEMHDILGHSVVLVISLLEVARFALRQSKEEFSLCLSESQAILADCLSNIQKTLSVFSSPEAEVFNLPDELDALFETVRSASVKVDFTHSGEMPILPPETAVAYKDALYKVCRESLTNAIRHGHADEIHVILRFRPDHAELFIIDNGRGCPEVKKGMGLLGIESRLEALNGSVTFGSFDDRGFCVNATFPFTPNHFEVQKQPVESGLFDW
jgi:signal transduction histidine kinase